jgi:hypothetical protein
MLAHFALFAAIALFVVAAVNVVDRIIASRGAPDGREEFRRRQARRELNASIVNRRIK